MTKYLRYVPALSRDEEATVAKVFKAFADKSGVLVPYNLLTAMKELHFDETEPAIFDLLSEFDAPEYKDGVTLEQLIDGLNEKLRDRESKKCSERVYDLFVDDPKGTITYEVLKKVSKEVGDGESDDQIRKRFEIASSNGKDIPFDEFHCIMIKDVSLNN